VDRKETTRLKNIYEGWFTAQRQRVEEKKKKQGINRKYGESNVLLLQWVNCESKEGR
jgi:hypothetical protein